LVRKYSPAEDHLWVSISQFAKEIDRTPRQAEKVLTRLGFVVVKTRKGSRTRSVVYDSHALEVLKGLLSVPHREIEHDNDWLAQFIKGEKHD
jgi:hypothetical protein